MSRKIPVKPVDIGDNSIAYLATSLEAVAARLRGAIGRPGAWQVLHWTADEAYRLATEARDIGDSERLDEAEKAGRS